MKKILYSLIAVLAMVMSSCSNDDIEITTVSNVTFKLNPETVVSGLVEQKAGDLKSLYSGTALHVSLYIYDKEGKLVSNDEEICYSYTQIMTSIQELKVGNYTAIATTHITGDNNYWTFSGIENLNEFKIIDNGYTGGKNKILGVSIFDFQVDKMPSTVDVDIKNAGAVALVQLYNWNNKLNLTKYYLSAKQACESVSFSNNKNIYYSLKNLDSYKYNIAAWNYNSNYSLATSYVFIFPTENASMHFKGITITGRDTLIGKELVGDIIVGDTYWIYYDFYTDETKWYSYNKTSSNQSMSEYKAMAKSANNSRIRYSEEGELSFK